MFSVAIRFFILLCVLEIKYSSAGNHDSLPWAPSALYVKTDNSRENVGFDKFPYPTSKHYKFHEPSYYHQYPKHQWPDPYEYKKPKTSKRTQYLKKSESNLPNSKWNVLNPELLNFPSLYLEAPLPGETINYYENSEKFVNNSEEDRKNEKTEFVNNSEEDKRNEKPEFPNNHKVEIDKFETSKRKNDSPVYVRDHDPEQQVEATDDYERAKSSEHFDTPKDISGNSKDRIEFQIHGHAGPDTYMFGYDTGNGENRQYRMEERHEDGTVTGHYGYVDARGKLRKVLYKASPAHGYQEKHHLIGERET